MHKDPVTLENNGITSVFLFHQLYCIIQNILIIFRVDPVLINLIKKKICNDFTLYFPMCDLCVTQPFILTLPYPQVLLNLFFLILKVLRYQINKKTFVYRFCYHFLISQLITEIDKIICNDNASWLPQRTSSLSYNLIGGWFMV